MKILVHGSWHWAKLQSRLRHKPLWYESVRIMHVGNNFCGGRVGAAAAREWALGNILARIHWALTRSQPAVARPHTHTQSAWARSSLIKTKLDFSALARVAHTKKTRSLNLLRVYSERCVYINAENRGGCDAEKFYTRRCIEIQRRGGLSLSARARDFIARANGIFNYHLGI